MGRKVQYTEYEHHEIEGMVEEFLAPHFPGLKDYSFVATEECGNGSSHSFDVEPMTIEEGASEDYHEPLEKKTFQYQNGTILNMLCGMGEVDEGDVLVNVCW